MSNFHLVVNNLGQMFDISEPDIQSAGKPVNSELTGHKTIFQAYNKNI